MQIPTSTSDSTPSDGFASLKAYAGSVLVEALWFSCVSQLLVFKNNATTSVFALPAPQTVHGYIDLG